MSKFRHLFCLKEHTSSSFVYTSAMHTARLDFVSGSCVRVAVYDEGEEMLPTFSVNPGGKFLSVGRSRLDIEGFCLFEPRVQLSSSVHSFCMQNGITLELDTENFLIKYRLDNEILFADRAPLAYNFENEFGRDKYHYITRMSGERIFGLGDKGGSLNKAGRAFRIETSDAMGYNACESDPLYKHIPFYICENSIGCYGIYYDTTDNSYMDLGKEINNYYPPYKYFRTEDNCLVYYVFFGSKLSVLQQFAGLCGRQAFPPKWSFDYCASTMAYTDAPDSQQQMQSFLDKLEEYDFSCKGFYLSSGYTSIGDQRFVFNWNNEKFPDVKKFVKDFAAEGIAIIPNIKPAFLENHPLYGEISEKELFVKNPDGTPFITEFWDGLGSYLDFTNPQAFEYWKSKVRRTLLDYGMASTWNDNNEFDIKDSEALACGFGRGSVKAGRIRPVLTYLMVAASFEAQLEQFPGLRPFLSTRSGSIAVRRMAQTWSGDNTTNFSDLRYCHYIGLTMSLSGLYFYGHDLGGFHGEMPSRELLLRWLQHGVFEPRLTIHSWNSDGSATMPWSYPDIVKSVRALFAQRKRLLPYIYNCAFNAVVNEIPVNAPSFLYYDDEELYSNTDSMMLGRDIYVAFAFDEGESNVNAYLPSGDSWYLGSRLYSGGQYVNLKIEPTDEMPYFIRSGCVLPEDEAPYGFKCSQKTVFTVYPVPNGEFESEFFDDDGKSFDYLNNNCVHLKFRVVCSEEAVSVCFENEGSIKLTPEIRLCGADSRKLIARARENQA